MNFAEHVKVRNEKFGAVIFETLKEKIFVTNQTGKDILMLLKEGSVMAEIVNFLTDRYKEDRTLVERDVKDFINMLFEKGLVSDAGSH